MKVSELIRQGAPSVTYPDLSKLVKEVEALDTKIERAFKGKPSALKGYKSNIADALATIKRELDWASDY